MGKFKEVDIIGNEAVRRLKKTEKYLEAFSKQLHFLGLEDLSTEAIMMSLELHTFSKRINKEFGND